jgi:SAM-dependent methyltransferase
MARRVNRRIDGVAPDPARIAPHLRRTREFFGARAATWDERFPDDEPAYLEAIATIGPKWGGVVVDLGCGTGRALPLLRHAVGPQGIVVGIDATPEMLRVASDRQRDIAAPLLLADVARLPVADGSVDAFFAAGLLTHVPDPHDLLRSLARAASPDCRLAVFHPIGRAALARRHHRELRPDELLDPQVLPGLLAASGWTLASIDDGEHRYLALAHVVPRG